ncbi:S26 family signal peptidase [Sphingorhabdus sp.]|uniref:S26 family signal peptidase n=1 Tax=Sphingorhabdus sp. TaxID=1902408 RepID=UPI0032B705CE
MDRATRLPDNKRRYVSIALLGAVLAGTQALGAWREGHALFINSSESLAHWAFFVESGQMPRKGEFAFFRAPQTALVSRHFGHAAPPFGKIVYGVAGDIVSRSHNIVAVNGKPVATLKPASRFGERLLPGPTGVIPDGCYFMATPHRDGLDSRYADIGFVCRRQIIGTGKAIL